MKRNAKKCCWLFAIALALPVSAEARALRLPASFERVDPSYWRGTLDLRDLPEGTSPAILEATIAVPVMAGGPVEATIAVNGFIAARSSIDTGARSIVRAEMPHRFISTVNRIEISVQRRGPNCTSHRCPVSGTHFVEPVGLVLDEAGLQPKSFSDFVTRFRAGVALQVERPEDLGLARMAKAAIAPRAPESGRAPTRIVVSRTSPDGAHPSLRFDQGPVRLASREGETVFSANDVAQLTVAQVMLAGGKPVLWVRPGSGTPPPAMELDYGDIAAFDIEGRRIAFSPDFDTALHIEYAVDAAADRLLTPWRIAIVCLWLAMTVGLALLIRRIPALKAEAAL